MSKDELDAVARDLAARGIATTIALGCAARREGRWELSVGGTTRAFFDLASLTKPMLAIAVARSGLSKDVRIGELVEETRGCETADATLEQLLSHRAGLEAHVALYEPLLRGRAVVKEEALRRAARARRTGDASVYSDLGYILAGEALARHLGVRDAGEAIERLVVAPLSAEDALGTARALRSRTSDFEARVVPTEVVAFRGGEVRGVVHDENAFALTGDGGSGHAGMFGTLEGLLAFACAADDAVERGAGPLASGDLRWLTAQRPNGSHRAGFDGKSGEGSSAGTIAGPRTYGHLGFTGTSFWIDPDAAAVVALLTNRVYPSRENVAIRAERPRVHDALFRIAKGY